MIAGNVPESIAVGDYESLLLVEFSEADDITEESSSADVCVRDVSLQRGNHNR